MSYIVRNWLPCEVYEYKNLFTSSEIETVLFLVGCNQEQVEIIISELQENTKRLLFRSDDYILNKNDRYINKNIFAHSNSSISNVEMLSPNKVVRVTFNDGSSEKAVCQESDVFSMETAIGICVAKHAMGGSSNFNNAVKKGMKVYQDKLNQEATEQAEQERIEKKRAKRKAYKERKAKKIAEAEREARIDEQTESYIRAWKYLKECKDE